MLEEILKSIEENMPYGYSYNIYCNKTKVSLVINRGGHQIVGMSQESMEFALEYINNFFKEISDDNNKTK